MSAVANLAALRFPALLVPFNMPNRNASRNFLLIFSCVSITLLVAAAVCVGSYIHAAQVGDNFESNIKAATTLVAQDEESLKDELASLSGNEGLTPRYSHHILVLFQHHRGPRGIHQIVAELRAASPSHLEDTTQFADALTSVLQSYSMQTIKHKRDLLALQNAYHQRLTRFWIGRWMRAAGYPKPGSLPALPTSLSS